MLRIGIMSPSEIAMRRFLPALESCSVAELAGIASASIEERGACTSLAHARASRDKVCVVAQEHSVAAYDSYEALLKSSDVDAVYLPLPPALHFRWAQQAIECGKHVMLEKPSTPNVNHTERLIALAVKRGLAVHENYAFVYHDRIKCMREMVLNGAIGEMRVARASFGFPYRGSDDFRYHASMGGGALLDCGGYPILLSSMLLGKHVHVSGAMLASTRRHDVDVCGSALLTNESGQAAQVSFGMDNSYKCDIELWGSKGYLRADRVFTPPPDMETSIEITGATDAAGVYTYAPCDQFEKSIEHFAACVSDEFVRATTYSAIVQQAQLVESVFIHAGSMNLLS